MSDKPPAGSQPRAPRPGAPGRTAEEIRRDIDLQQAELARARCRRLRTRVTELTDWRRQIDEHREQLITGAAVAGLRDRRDHRAAPRRRNR